MDQRRKICREKKEQEMLQKYRDERPKIQEQFSDLKRELKGVSHDEWINIPEVGDGRKRKQRGFGRHDRETAIPDSIINMQRNMTQITNSIVKNVQGRTTTSLGGELDMERLGKARNQIMDVKLKQVSDSVSGQTANLEKGETFLSASVGRTKRRNFLRIRRAGENRIRLGKKSRVDRQAQ